MMARCRQMTEEEQAALTPGGDADKSVVRRRHRFRTQLEEAKKRLILSHQLQQSYQLVRMIGPGRMSPI